LLSQMNGVVIDDKSCLEALTVTDHEGNVYATVKIGNQCWMRDNLRTTTSPSTKTYLIHANRTYTGKQARWYGDDSAKYAPKNYGLIYNWNAAVDTFNKAYGETSVYTSSSLAVPVAFNGHRRGICPAGWHLPSDDEWNTMTNFVSSQSAYVCGTNSSNIAKALASKTGWISDDNDCSVGNDTAANNATGFSAVPAGNSTSTSSPFSYEGTHADFWSATQYSSSSNAYAYRRSLRNERTYVNSNYNGKIWGYSVRCLRD